MTTPVPAPPSLPPSVPPPVRKAARERDGRWIGGVCAGLAEHFRVPVAWVRITFVVLLCCNFIGALAYGLLWLLLPERRERSAPGLEANTRQGLRTPPASRRRLDLGVLISMVLIGIGLVWITQRLGWGLPAAMLWPLLFAATGLALVWRQADNTVDGATGPRNWSTVLFARQGAAAAARVVVGLGLVGAALSLVVADQVGWRLLPKALALLALAVGGVGLVMAPWLSRLRQQLSAAHEEKLLADQRADLAAHLHDSVLQTLALIQRQADDPRAVATLARRQERELRTWLYGDVPAESTFKAGLTRAAAEIEDERGVPVELVVVGDAELDERTQAVVAAAREAIMNAAKHSGADLIDVYAEAADTLEVFVRDRGRGFDLDAVDADRQGVRRSIVERMERHGGHAQVRSAPGEGTEVRLEMSR